MAESASSKQILVRSAATAVLAALIWAGCSQDSEVTSPEDQLEVLRQQLAPALAVQQQHTPELMARADVVGTAVGLSEHGEPLVKIFTLTQAAQGLPDRLDGVAVRVEVTGPFIALQDPTDRFPRPVPTGVSTGHPDITAGTICCRVSDGAGNLYAMSNNHVYADVNQADIDDPVIQPGDFDGGVVPGDVIGNLADFEPIQFCSSDDGGGGGGGRAVRGEFDEFQRDGGDGGGGGGGGGGGTTCPPNEMDAAIALTTSALVGTSTPANGYGTPTSTPVSAVLDMNVKKYGRTTGLTFGQVAGINATVDVNYGTAGVARFAGQIVITPGSFSAGGDSGSLIVDENNNPVGLLFAGSSLSTIANPIGPVLDRFAVTIDSDDEPPPPPTPDIAVTDLVGPGSVTEGDVAQVTATVTNVSAADVTDDIVVTLVDDTDGGAIIGQQTIVGGLAAEESASPAFNWNTTGASIGDHDVTASHSFADGSAANNSATIVVTIIDDTPPPTSSMHVGDLDGSGVVQARAWNASVEILVLDDSQNPVSNATVSGSWTAGGAGGGGCTTDVTGRCTVTRTGISTSEFSAVFSVTDVTHATLAYDPTANTDPDGDSDGTTITVPQPGTGGGR